MGRMRPACAQAQHGCKPVRLLHVEQGWLQVLEMLQLQRFPLVCSAWTPYARHPCMHVALTLAVPAAAGTRPCTGTPNSASGE